jgi:hypothetical protein
MNPSYEYSGYFGQLIQLTNKSKTYPDFSLTPHKLKSWFDNFSINRLRFQAFIPIRKAGKTQFRLASSVKRPRNQWIFKF